MRNRVIGAVALAVFAVGLGWHLSRGKARSKENAPALQAARAAAQNPTSRRANSIHRGANASVNETDTSTNSAFKRLYAGDKELFAVPAESIRAYLESNGFSAESLLAAFQVASNRDYLLSAATNHPHDPRVQFAVLLNDALPLQRAEWLARFKQDAPDNALPNYIAARDAFKAQHLEEALREVNAAAAKPHYRDYLVENVHALQELYLADGRSPAEAKLAGMAAALMPHLGMLRDLAKDEMTLQKRYAAAGDMQSADAMAANVAHLGQQLSTGEGAFTLLSQLIGVSIEVGALKEYAADAQPAFLSTTAQERLAQLQQQRQSIRDGAKLLDGWMTTATERDVMAYFDRMKLYGESGALAWLQNRMAAANRSTE